MNQPEKTKLFLKGIKVTEDEIIKSIRSAIDDNSSKLITYFNQNSLNEYHTNSEFREILQSNFEIFSDGTGMSFALKLLLGIKADRFNATDLYTKVFDDFFAEKIPIYIIGGNYDCPVIQRKLSAKMVLAGYSNGYIDSKNIEPIVKKVKLSGAKLIGIGMGTPKQEIFAFRMSLQLKNCVILCVGNFINFHMGITKRAPVFIRNSGIEWVHRLISEPQKLWKRYIFGIPLLLSE